jgi:plastocyanin
MTRRMTVALAATAALGVSALGVGVAGAATAKNRIEISGGASIKPGKSVTDDQHFSPQNLEVKSGATVKLVNKAKTEDPHTISLVKKSDLPKTAKQAFNCATCNAILGSHEIDEQSGTIGKPVVDVGQPGYDTPGDSTVVMPKGKISFKVTAKKGSTLYYLCAIHPWMQGRIKVK